MKVEFQFVVPFSRLNTTTVMAEEKHRTDTILLLNIGKGGCSNSFSNRSDNAFFFPSMTELFNTCFFIYYCSLLLIFKYRLCVIMLQLLYDESLEAILFSRDLLSQGA